VVAAPRSLLIREWPAADREAWEQECVSGARLRRGGRASHLRPVTRDALARGYGLFLDFLSRGGSLNKAASAGAHVTPDNVNPYVAELQKRVRSFTVYGSVNRLRRTTEIMAPTHDVLWLRELESDLHLLKQAKSKLHRLVFAEVLVKAGLTIMTEAEAAEHRTRVQRATQYRNGLMIALLACCPIRLKNFAALSLGETLIQIEECWWIVLRPQDTKEKRADERHIPEFLNAYIGRYLSYYRQLLARPETRTNRCWISRIGTPMTYFSVQEAVTETTLATTGISVSPHLFRTCAATTAAVHAGATPHLASAILHHRDTGTTQQHYNRASSLSAGATYQSLIGIYRGT
jgi:site-specific recombinase XerD